MIASKFGGLWKLQESELVDGAVFIEEDPECFAFVMKYLRMLRFGAQPGAWPEVLPARRSSLRRVVDYWGLKQLADMPMMPSLIIDPAMMSTLRSWLAGPDDEPELELLFRASEHGFTGSCFHQRCDEKGATLMVARSAGGFIFGGFAEHSWSNSNSQSYSDSFLFQLGGPGVTSPLKLSITKNAENGLIYDSDYGPIWGKYDLYIGKGLSHSTTATFDLGHTYSTDNVSNLIRTLAEDGNVEVKDYEVFKVQFKAAAQPAPKKIVKSDPVAVLNRIGFPDSIDDWHGVQDTVWAGHDPLPRGWIRIWSRNYNCVWYLRLEDHWATFELEELG